MAGHTEGYSSRSPFGIVPRHVSALFPSFLRVCVRSICLYVAFGNREGAPSVVSACCVILGYLFWLERRHQAAWWSLRRAALPPDAGKKTKTARRAL